MTKEHITMRLDADVVAKLKEAVASTGMSQSDLVEECLFRALGDAVEDTLAKRASALKSVERFKRELEKARKAREQSQS